MFVEASQPGVIAGIDAAVVAAHHVAFRDGDRWVRFKVQPTLAGMAELTERLRPYSGAMVTAEPTAGTWLPLGAAVRAAGCRFHVPKLLQAIKAELNKQHGNGREDLLEVAFADPNALDLPDNQLRLTELRSQLDTA